jgi:hypothetical protein
MVCINIRNNERYNLASSEDPNIGIFLCSSQVLYNKDIPYAEGV